MIVIYTPLVVSPTVVLFVTVISNFLSYISDRLPMLLGPTRALSESNSRPVFKMQVKWRNRCSYVTAKQKTRYIGNNDECDLISCCYRFLLSITLLNFRLFFKILLYSMQEFKAMFRFCEYSFV